MSISRASSSLNRYAGHPACGGVIDGFKSKTISDRRTLPMDLHHPILKEFPEHRETAKQLKLSDALFRKWFEEYHQLDDAICRIEEEIEFANDQEIEEMKMRRAWLKDRIYFALTHAAPMHMA